MRSARFTAEPLADSWLVPVDCRELADLCAGARLTCIQAEVVRLTATGWSPGEIDAALALPSGSARYHIRRAERQLRRSQSWLMAAVRAELRLLLTWYRNTFPPKPGCPIIRKVPGGWETVRVRARPGGSLPEDFAEEEGRLLRALPHLLVGRTEDARDS